DLKHDERYSRGRLDELQHTVQTGPWFSSVVIDIDRDPAHPQRAPVRMTVVERPRREVGLAIGYGTDDGARAETAYRDRNLFDRGLDLQSSIRAAQQDQLGYVDVYLPPGRFGEWHGKPVTFTDSFGVLAEHSTVQKNVRSRFAAAATGTSSSSAPSTAWASPTRSSASFPRARSRASRVRSRPWCSPPGATSTTSTIRIAASC